MQMKELRKQNYQVFRNCESGVRRVELERALAYIDQLGSISANDISDWPALEIFKNPGSDKGFIHTDKNKINEIFFQELQKRKEVVLEIKLAPHHTEGLRYTFMQTITQYRKGLQEKSRQFQSEANTGYTRYTNAMLGFAQIQQEILQPPPTPDSKVAQIAKIVQDPFWELTDDIGSDYIQFTTKPVILQYKNKDQAADMTVPLGRFLFRIKAQTLTVECWPMNDKAHPNCQISSHYHPHLDTSHRFCFGTMLNDLHTAQAELDYFKVMEICKIVLTGYWPDNPFVHLHRFRDEISVRALHEQKAKEEREAKANLEKERKRDAKRMAERPGVKPGVGDYNISPQPDFSDRSGMGGAGGGGSGGVRSDNSSGPTAPRFTTQWTFDEIAPQSVGALSAETIQRAAQALDSEAQRQARGLFGDAPAATSTESDVPY